MIDNLPNNLDAEQQLLGALLVNSKNLSFISHFLKPEHFHDTTHQRIYTKIELLNAEGIAASPVLLMRKFELEHGLEGIGGKEYLSRLAVIGAGFVNVKDVAREICDLYKKRELLYICEEIMAEAQSHDSEMQGEEIMNSLTGKISELSKNSATSKIMTSRQISEQIYHDLNEKLECFSTGIPALDNAMAGGIYARKSYGFAARKKVGKTILCSTISHNLNMAGIKHLMICGEMGAKQVHQRNVSRALNRNSNAFLDGTRTNEQFQYDVAGWASKDPGNALYLDAPGITFDELKRQVSYAVLNCGIKGFILDYWQLVGGKQSRQSMSEHLEKVAQWIADFCNANNIFSVVMAQVNQDGNTRGSEGMRLAFDQVYQIHRCPKDEGATYYQPDMAWFEMMDTRYTMWQNIGCEQNPIIEIKLTGPYFEQIT
jgi:replicative DNA helicase